MCGGGGGPKRPARVPEAPVAPAATSIDGAQMDARRRRKATGRGNISNILSSARGTDGGATTQATLLGR